MSILRDYERKNRFDRVLAQNVDAFAVLYRLRNESAVRKPLLYGGVIGVEVKILFKEIFVVTFDDLLVAQIGDSRHMIICAHLDSVALLHETKDLSAIEGLSDVESRRFGD